MEEDGEGGGEGPELEGAGEAEQSLSYQGSWPMANRPETVINWKRQMDLIVTTRDCMKCRPDKMIRKRNLGNARHPEERACLDSHIVPVNSNGRGLKRGLSGNLGTLESPAKNTNILSLQIYSNFGVGKIV